jgi:3-dehydrosphinganine reductase
MTNSTQFWANKNCLITGGSSGIGLAMAKQLAAHGAHIWLAARNPERLAVALELVRAARRDPAQRAGVFSVDVTQADQVAEMMAAFQAEAGVPDVLINSAGIIHPGRVEELDLEVYRWAMDLNVMGTIIATKAVLPGMLARHSGQIINISSVAGFLSIFGYTAYSASKFAIRGFTDALRAELKPQGIRVSLALPPDTDTPGLDYELPKRPPELRAIAGLSKALSADKVAADLLKQAAQGKYLLLPGFDTRMMWALAHVLAGGIYPLMDYLVADAQKKQAGKK